MVSSRLRASNFVEVDAMHLRVMVAVPWCRFHVKVRPRARTTDSRESDILLTFVKPVSGCAVNLSEICHVRRLCTAWVKLLGKELSDRDGTFGREKETVVRGNIDGCRTAELTGIVTRYCKLLSRNVYLKCSLSPTWQPFKGRATVHASVRIQEKKILKRSQRYIVSLKTGICFHNPFVLWCRMFTQFHIFTNIIKEMVNLNRDLFRLLYLYSCMHRIYVHFVTLNFPSIRKHRQSTREHSNDKCLTLHFNFAA